jgi:hypothetical protein
MCDGTKRAGLHAGRNIRLRRVIHFREFHLWERKVSFQRVSRQMVMHRMMRELIEPVIEVSDSGSHGFCDERNGKAEEVGAETTPTSK